jgi:pimeloyl-ACP methyl ester carboxylesterase
VTNAPRERIVRFGVRQGLAGILSTPRVARETAPHVVLVNAGIVHRVGPARLYVDIARSLAALGYPVLRFDLSGLGDSETVGGTSLIETAVSDVRTALDFLESTRKTRSFILCGLCAGAGYSCLTAFVDPRVAGVMLIEPGVSRTRRSKLIHLGRRLRHLPTWSALLTFRHPIWHRTLEWTRSVVVGHATDAPTEQPEPQDAPPPPSEIRASLARIIDRGVHLMFVFTGGDNDYYNYRGQLFDLFPGLDFREQLQLEYMPETDHVIGDEYGRSRLIEAMEGWITERFPVAEAERELA